MGGASWEYFNETNSTICQKSDRLGKEAALQPDGTATDTSVSFFQMVAVVDVVL